MGSMFFLLFVFLAENQRLMVSSNDTISQVLKLGICCLPELMPFLYCMPMGTKKMLPSVTSQHWMDQKLHLSKHCVFQNLVFEQPAFYKWTKHQV